MSKRKFEEDACVPQNMIEIDGSILDGGGQILRIAITLSALCEIPIRVTKIRAGRSKPGLMAQHLKGLQLVRDMSKGSLRGDELGSTEIEFRPNKITGGNFHADTKTAGSITLLLQVALPCALFANSPTRLTLIGGTNTEMAPQLEYMTEIFRPNLEKFGASFEFDLIKRGYFPKGGGKVEFDINPVKSLKSVEMLDRGNITCIHGWSFVAGTLPIHIAHASGDAALDELKRSFPQVKRDIERYKEHQNMAPNNCAGLNLMAETSTNCILGSSILGQRNVSPEEAGRKVSHELVEILKSGACIDQHGQDQIIVLMALAEGKSQIKVSEITMHTKTAIYVTELITKVKFDIKEEGENNIISCNGIGYKNKYL